jgi:hypothetical protein
MSAGAASCWKTIDVFHPIEPFLVIAVRVQISPIAPRKGPAMPPVVQRIITAVSLLGAAAAGCGQPKITTTGGPGRTDAGGRSTDGAGAFGFDRDALPPPTDGPTSKPVIGPGGDLPSCAAEMHQAQLSPVDLLLLVDTSGSMNESAGPQSKWQLARSTLGRFWKDPRSSGLGMGLQFFPVGGTDRTCLADTDCAGGGTPSCWIRGLCLAAGAALSLPGKECDPDAPLCGLGTTCTPVGRCAITGGDCLRPGTPCPTGEPGDQCTARQKICRNIGGGSCTQMDYQTLAVPIGALPAAEPALTRAITIKEPIGFTPTVPAVAGALGHLRQHLVANPSHRGALVILTDGLPLGCTANDAFVVTGSIMAARAGTPAILTYAIGVFAASQFNGPNTLDQWAAAGGTGTATVVTPTADFADKLLTALNAIRGAALPCEFAIPPSQSGSIDFGKVNVSYSGSGGPADVLYVERADRCDPAQGGWYYDVDPNVGTPGRVLICPATCQRFKGDAAARVDLVFGCATKVIP